MRACPLGQAHTFECTGVRIKRYSINHQEVFPVFITAGGLPGTAADNPSGAVGLMEISLWPAGVQLEAMP